MGKYHNNKNKIYEDKKSVIFWIIMTFVVLFLFIAPFYKALFNGYQTSFEGPIYTAVMWSSIILIVLSMQFFRRWQLLSHRDVLIVFVWLIPLSYLISSFGAASGHLAMNEVYIKVLCVVFFMIGAYFASSKLGSNIIKYGLIGSGYMLVIFGYMNWFGNASYRDAVLGSRLSNVFQYPNAYAAYLIAILFGCLILSSNSKKWYITILNAFMLVPITLSFLLTTSRGGLVILPIVILIYLFFLPWRKQLFVMLYIAMSGVSSLAIFSYIKSIRTQLITEFDVSISFKGWICVVSLSFFISIIVYMIQKYIVLPLLQKRPAHKIFQLTNVYIPIFVAVTFVVISILIFGNYGITKVLPNDIQLRIESFSFENSSISSRGVFIEDSIKIVKDYPIIGLGGGAWLSLYDKYKSYPYTSRQTHAVFLQYMVETGLIGFAIFILLLGYIIFFYIRNINRSRVSDWNETQLIFPIICLSILGHSTIDFDMTFVYLSAIVFLSLGAMVSVLESNKLSVLTSLNIHRFNKLFPLALTIVSILIFTNVTQAIRANALYTTANNIARTTVNYNDIRIPLDAALKLQHNNPEYVLFKTRLLKQLYDQTKNDIYANEAISLLQDLQRTEPYNRQMIEQRYTWFIANGEYDLALSLTESSLNQFPWDVNFYEKIIMLNFDLGNKARLQGADKKMTEYWRDSLNYLNLFNDKINEINALPESQKRGFMFMTTPNIALSIGQIYYMRGEYSQASTLLRTVLSTNFDEKINRATARWYLASLLKQNIDNSSFFSNLVEKYPEEAQNIEEILKERF